MPKWIERRPARDRQASLEDERATGSTIGHQPHRRCEADIIPDLELLRPDRHCGFEPDILQEVVAVEPPRP